MKNYPSYKDSDVEWIGEIPSGWDVKKLKYIGDLYGGLTGKSGKDFNNEDNPHNKPFIPFTNIFNNVYISDKHFQYVNVEPDERQNRVRKNDLFFLMSSEGYDDLGKSSILISEINELYLNSFCKGFRINTSKVNPIFINYQLLGDTHRKLISIEGKGFTRINLRQDKLKNTYMFIPPLQEQKQISDYLDYKTSKIDTLIEKTQQKIELLKEQRTSLINTTVTKGLNPSVEMKDSGVEWIGEIPSKWDVIPLKYVSEYNLNSLGNNTDPEYELNYLEISDVDSLGNIKKPTQYIFSKSPSRCRRIVQKNDIIISTVRTYLRSIGFIKEESKDLICSTGFCVITPNKKVILPNLLFYMVRMESFISTVISLSEGVSYPSINSDKLVSVKILIPPLQEQQQIIDYLDQETSKIDKLIDIESKRIILLKEYRQSLISDVVTGKVDVRDEVLV